MKDLDDQGFEEVARYFAALAVPARLKILDALRGGERNVTELTELTACAQANVSKHLAVLAHNGMVGKSSRGTSVYYRIADPRIYRLCDLVCGSIAQRCAELGARRRKFAASSPAR
jgi:DNA-binding transcriptional ArsR family regulator